MSTHDDINSIAVGDESIQGTVVAPAMLVPGVLFVHGWGGSQQQYIARAHDVAALGCVCLTFDLRGHVETRSRYETVTRQDNLQDVIAAYDSLARHRGVDPTRIAVVGSSYGGYLAAILCGIKSVKWLALRSPALYRDADWQLPKAQLAQHQGLGAYRLEVLRPGESRALQSCSQFEGDVLIVESELDLIVPHQVIANYRAACTRARSVTNKIIAGANHGLSTEAAQSAYSELLLAWLKEMIKGPSPAKDLAAKPDTKPAVAEHA